MGYSADCSTRHGQNWVFVVCLNPAFVALVLRFDSFRGLQGQTLRPFFAGWRMSRRLGARGVHPLGDRETDQEKQSNPKLEVGSSVKGTRNSEVVQCFKRLWFHPAANGGGRFCPLLRNHDGWLQVTERGASC